MRNASQTLAVLSAIAVGTLAWPVAGDETKQPNQAQNLERLLEQRQATLEQLVELVTAGYRAGTTGFDSVVRATDQLLAAELELAENNEARMTILQKRAERMKSLFAMVNTRAKAGQVSQAELLDARAELLESQIQLAREQAGTPKR